MDNYLKANLDHAKEAIEKKWDCWLAYTGIEGSGKTTICCSNAYYVTYNEKTGKSTFTLDNIVWTVDQFKKALTSVPEGSAIVWDEAVFGLLSTESMTEVQRTLMKYATTIRKRRLFVFLVIPYIFMLGKYFVSRCRGMVYVRTPDGINRGKFRFYNREQCMYLYAEGKKHWTYPSKCHFSFNGDHVVKGLAALGIDEEEYERRKDAAIQGLYEKKDKVKDKYQDAFFRVVGYVKEKEDLIWKDVPVALNLSMSWESLSKGYSRYKERMEERNLKPNRNLLPEI